VALYDIYATFSSCLCPQVELQAVSRAAAEVMGTDWLKVFEGTATACGVMSLRPGCVYRLRVRSANSAGWGSWCLPLQVSCVGRAVRQARGGQVHSVACIACCVREARNAAA
jgi:hypothetical protein